MIKQSILGLAVAAATGLGAVTIPASAQVNIYIDPYPRYNNYGATYRHGYYGEFTPRWCYRKGPKHRHCTWRNGKKKCYRHRDTVRYRC